jgi:hypothetical protein
MYILTVRSVVSGVLATITMDLLRYLLQAAPDRSATPASDRTMVCLGSEGTIVCQ